MRRDFLLIFVMRIRQLVVLQLSSFLPSRVYFVFEYLGELFPSLTILLVDQFVLFDIQFCGDALPPIPIFEHKLVAEAH